MTTPTDIITLALQNLVNDDSTATPTNDDLSLGLSYFINLCDYLQLDPASAIGLEEYVYTPTAGDQSFTVGASKSVTTLTSSSTTATATVADHGFVNSTNSTYNPYVNISGATPTAYNGRYQITVVDANTFTYTFAGGTSPATGTISCDADIITNMPPRVEESSFVRLGGVDFLIGFASSFEEYNAQPVKTNQGYPTKAFYMPNTYSNWATMYLWPASNGAEVHLWIRQEALANFSSMTLTTTLILPMGTQKPLIDILAAELCDPFNILDPMYTRLKQKGANSIRKLKNSRLKIAELSMPANLGRFTANNYTA